MRFHLKFSLSLILVLFSLFAKGQLARINDPDGFTFIRSGQGKDFAIVDTIKKDELFNCRWSNDEWIYVTSMKFEKSKQIVGYMNRSRIQLIELLDDSSKKQLLQSVFKKETQVGNDFQYSVAKHDSLDYHKKLIESENYGNNYFYPLIDPIFEGYFCKTLDTTTLQIYFKARWADRGTACEIPANGAADCFACQTGLFIRQVKVLKNKKERDLIWEDVDYGLGNLSQADENGKPTKMEYQYSELKKKLDSARK